MENVKIEVKEATKDKKKNIFFPGNIIITTTQNAVLMITDCDFQDMGLICYFSAIDIRNGKLFTEIKAEKSQFRQFEGEIVIKVTAP